MSTTPGTEESGAEPSGIPSDSAQDSMLGIQPGASAPSVRTRRVGGSPGSPLRNLLIIGGAGILFLIVAIVSYVSSKRDAPPRTGAAAVGVTIENTGVTADEELSPRYQEMLEAENAAAVAAAADGSGVVVPMLVGTPDRVEPAGGEVVDMRPYTPDRSTYGGNRTEASTAAHDARVARMAEQLAALREQWRAGAMQEHTRVAPETAAASIGAASVAAPGALPGPAVELFTANTAVIEVGASSDYPAEVIARLTSGPLRGGRIIGRMQGSPRGNVHDRLQLRFDRVEWQGVVYSTDAVAVDPATRIPALQGDINRHLVYNTVSQAGAAFLAGMAAGLTRGGSRSIEDETGTFVVPTYTLRDLLYAEGARELAGALRQGSPRLPTITLPMGAPVAVVFVEPLVTQQPSTALAANTSTPSSQAGGDPTLSGAAAPQGPVVLPDGTEFRFEPLPPLGERP